VASIFGIIPLDLACAGKHTYSLRRILVTAVVKIPEGVVVGFQIFAWVPN
jgi:hypothetical protein